MGRASYVAAVVVFALSGAMVLAVPHGEFLQQLAAVPLVGSLLAVLVQVLRDQAAHQRQVQIGEEQRRFTLGASSHMANVAFDKHVVFCEEYVAEALKTLDTLFREGPTEKALAHAATLSQLRRKHAVWLTDELDKRLQKFEAALRQIGATDWYLRNAKEPHDRQEKVDLLHKTFADVLGKENMGESWLGQALTDELAASSVVQGLRRVLGTEALTELRSILIQSSLQRLGRDGSPR